MWKEKLAALKDLFNVERRTSSLEGFNHQSVEWMGLTEIK